MTPFSQSSHASSSQSGRFNVHAPVRTETAPATAGSSSTSTPVPIVSGADNRPDRVAAIGMASADIEWRAESAPGVTEPAVRKRVASGDPGAANAKRAKHTVIDSPSRSVTSPENREGRATTCSTSPSRQSIDAPGIGDTETSDTSTGHEYEGSEVGGTKQLSENLKSSSALNGFDFDPEAIGRQIFEVLKVNNALRSLDLSDTDFDKDTIDWLAEGLKINRSLERLELAHYFTRTDDAMKLADALRVNSSLRTFELDDFWIDAECAWHLFDAVKINSSLKRLALYGCDIGSGGAWVLSEALKINSTLTELELDGNEIDFEGATALADALKSNQTLRTLGLDSNRIDDAGAKALADALKCNSSLTSLTLGLNEMDDDAIWLSGSIRSNGATTSLHDELGESQVREINRLLALNRLLANHFEYPYTNDHLQDTDSWRVPTDLAQLLGEALIVASKMQGDTIEQVEKRLLEFSLAIRHRV